MVFVEALLYSAVLPLVPGYAEKYDLSKLEVGVLVGAYTLGSLAAALPSGLLVIQIGVRRALLAGLLVLGVSTILFGLTESIRILDAARFCQGLGAALSWTAALAWLVESTPRARRGELLGKALALAAVGGLAGPLVGAVASVSSAELVFVAVGGLTICLGAWAASERPPPPHARDVRSINVSALWNGRIGQAMWLMALPSILVGLIGVLVPLQLHVGGMTALAIGGVFLVASVAESVASVLAGRWADRAGRLVPLRVSLVAAAIACSALAFVVSAWAVSCLAVLAGFVYGAFFAPVMTLLTDEVEATGVHKAIGFGLLMAAWAPGQLFGSVGGGALASWAGDAFPYLVAAALCVGTLVWLLRGRAETKVIDLAATE